MRSFNNMIFFQRQKIIKIMKNHEFFKVIKSHKESEKVKRGCKTGFLKRWEEDKDTVR